MTAAQLLHKYDRPVPRYTSYPTVPYWQKTPPTESAWLHRVKLAYAKQREISLYIHLPFCESLCTYCGCNKRITKNHGMELPYIEAVLTEWRLYCEQLPYPPIIKELHLGGGTPTFFAPENLDLLLSGIFEHALQAEEHDFSFEAHPANTQYEHLAVLAKWGFNRLSIGVQDFSEDILNLINRPQTFQSVADTVFNARSLGYQSINFDLIFGLPKQSLANIDANMEALQELRPERIAFYSYAHVPWISPAQRAYSVDDLPKGADKRALYERGKKAMEDLGYIEIGLDHFSLASDDLYLAQQNGSLHRNFMGYTPYSTMLCIALGVSAISDAGDAFVQNEKKVEAYQDRIARGELAIIKGHLLNDDDRIIKKHILQLMCGFATSWDVKEADKIPGLAEAKLTWQEMEKDGLLRLWKNGISVKDAGKPFIRNICLALDQHYHQNQPKTATFSQAV